MLNKNLIGKSIATAVAGAFLLSAVAFAAGSVGVVVEAPTAVTGKAVEAGKAAGKPGVVAPGVSGQGSAGVVNKGVEAKSRAQAASAQKAGETQASAVDAQGIGHAKGFVAPQATSGVVARDARDSQASHIAAGVAALNVEDARYFGQAIADQIAAINNNEERAGMMLIAANQKLAVQTGALTKEAAAAVMRAELAIRAATGETVQDGSAAYSAECQAVWQSPEAAGNDSKAILAAEKALSAVKPSTQGGAIAVVQGALDQSYQNSRLASDAESARLLRRKLAKQDGSNCPLHTAMTVN